MAVTETNTAMSGEQMVALSRKHTIFEWSAQSTVDPIPVARAKGIYFWTPEGKRFIDFNSQLMCVNIGHGDERVIRAIQEQAAMLAYANPFMATEVRARLGAKLAEITPGDIDASSSPTAAPKRTRTRSRSRVGSPGVTRFSRAIARTTVAPPARSALTGDPRRWAAEPGIPGVLRIPNSYHGIQRGWDTTEDALAEHEEMIQLEGANTIAGFIVEPVVGTNGILVPPDGLHAGRSGTLRQARHPPDCRRSDGGLRAHRRMVLGRPLERRAGSDVDGQRTDQCVRATGRCWNATADRRPLHENVFYGGLTYNSHPLACAAALATIAVYEEDDLIERAARWGS